MKYLLPIVLLLAVISCTSPKQDTQQPPIFSEIDGVTLVDDSCCIYQYKDTLYYFNDVSDCLFKIPYGFHYGKLFNWGEDALLLWNEDSTMTITLTCLDRGYPRDKNGEPYPQDIISQYACDNGDIRMHYECSDSGYLKVGFNEDFRPIVEKGVCKFDVDDEILNTHTHILRFEYPDTLAKQAFNIDWEYISPWPNNFYK